MKRLTAILLALILCLSACSGSRGGPPESPAPTEAPKPQPTDEPGPTPRPVQEEVGQTADEIREAVEIEIDEKLSQRYQSVPEDMAGIICASASQWMEYAFTDQAAGGQTPPPLEGYACTALRLYDVSEDERVFCYSMRCEYKPVDDGDWEYWVAGNTGKADREGWYGFSRQLAVARDDEAWEVVSVGTGGVSVEDYLDRAGNIS